MIFLLFIFSITMSAHAMDSYDALRSAIMRSDTGHALALLNNSVDVNKPDMAGNYLLHWAILKSFDVGKRDDWRLAMETKMSIVNALLLRGADYTTQERGSKRTVFHVIVHHLSPDSKELVSFALTLLLRHIAQREVNAAQEQFSQNAFVESVLNLCKRKDSTYRSVLDILEDKKSTDLMDKERIESAYRLAVAKAVIRY